MRRSTRKRLRLLGLLGLLVVALGAAAVAGWLPPVNHWVERRLLAELRVLGVETSATSLRELSWRRAVAGPVELQLPGLTVRAEEVRAELGWSVLAGRTSPEVVLRGLLLDVDVDRLAELRGALQSQSGGFPYGRLAVEDSKVVLRQGERRLELPFAGFIDSRVEELRAELVVTAPALSGRLKLRTDLGEDSVELDLREGRIAPLPWRELLAALAAPELLALDATSPDAIQISGTTTFAAGRLRAAKVVANLPALRWRPEGQQADLAAVSVQIGCATEGRWRIEARTTAAAWQRGESVAGLTELDFVAEPGAAQLRFGGGRVLAAGTELQLQGCVEAHWTDALVAATAEATVKFEFAAGAAWGLAAPCELVARWNGAELALSTPRLALARPQVVQVQAVEATVGGLRTENPTMTARASVAALPLELFGVPEFSMQPAQVAAQLSLTAGLARGQEGVRVEWSVPQQRRVFAWAGGKGEASIGGEGIVNLDRNYLSGRAAFELRALSAAGEDWSAAAQTATFGVRLPRVWLSAVRGWGGLTAGRLARELAWAGDYDGKLTGGLGRFGGEVRLNGVELRGASRGAELFETGGADLGGTVGEILIGNRRILEGKVQATLGLEGGAVQGGCSVPDLLLQPAFAQTVHWNAGVEAEGSFGFEPSILTGNEPWGQWWPALAAGKFSGGIGFRGHSRFAAGVWSAGADVVLQDFSATWPAPAITVERINGTLAVVDLLAPRTAPAQRLTVGRAVLAGVELTDTAMEFSLDGPDRVQVAKLAASALGGRLEAAAFAFDPRRPEPAIQLRMTGARLEQLLRLFDDVPAQAEGPVDGDLPVAWKDAQLHLGAGYVQLVPGEFGRVHFTRDLHLLTSGRSPSSLGFAALLEVERSIQTLHFDRLRIDTYPKDSPGQSLRLRLVGAPAGGTVSSPVNLDVNVNAPLEHFFNWGRNRGALTAPAP